MTWLDNHQTEDADVYESKQKDIEGVVNPIMQKLYAAAGGAEAGPCGSARVAGIP